MGYAITLLVGVLVLVFALWLMGKIISTVTRDAVSVTTFIVVLFANPKSRAWMIRAAVAGLLVLGAWQVYSDISSGGSAALIIVGLLCAICFGAFFTIRLIAQLVKTRNIAAAWKSSPVLFAGPLLLAILGGLFLGGGA